MSGKAKLGLFARALLEQLRLWIGLRLVGLIAPLLTMEVAPAITVVGPIIFLPLRSKTLQ